MKMPIRKKGEPKSIAPAEDYAIVIRALSAAEGGGYFAEIPDLPGCMGDGKSEREAIADVHAAARAWIAEAKRLGRPVPRPGDAEAYSGKWVQRVPRNLHRRLASRAKQEGVSLNTLAATILAEGLAQRRG